MLRVVREAAGMSQAELAAAAGVSRQAIGAIETGAHRPGVDAALAIAAALGRTVEEVFGARDAGAPAPMAGVDGSAPAEGALVRAASVGERRVAVPLAPARDAAWPLPDAVVRGDAFELLPGARAEGFVLVGCDPALGLAAELGPRAGARRLLVAAGSTGAALEALERGTAHAALVHGPPGELPSAPPGVLRLHLARWRAGLAVAAGTARERAALPDRGPVIQREASASVQQAFTRALAAAGRRPPRGPRASGHLDAARRVAAGAPAAVTMEPAALHHGVGFAPLEEHVCEIWVDPRWAGHPGAEALGDVLASRAFVARLRRVAGYDVDGCGTRR